VEASVTIMTRSYAAWWKTPRYKKTGHLKTGPMVGRVMDKDRMVSMYLPEAQGLPWEEASKLVLPCGETLGVMWGRLKRALHSYRVARKQGDVQLTNRAASLVHIIREDMGIYDSIWPVIEEDHESDADQVFV
jgi:hypothetical protein